MEYLCKREGRKEHAFLRNPGARWVCVLRTGRGLRHFVTLSLAGWVGVLLTIPYTRSVTTTAPVPLVRWDGLHLVIDLEHVERLVRRRLEDIPYLRQVSLVGAGDALEIGATVVWKGVTTRAAVRLGEIRLRHRHLGFRLRRLRVLGGVPLPRGAVEMLLDSLESELVTVIRGQGIVVVDLGRWLPAEASITVITVQATRHRVHLWLGPGHLESLPSARRELQLEAGEQRAVLGPEGESEDGPSGVG